VSGDPWREKTLNCAICAWFFSGKNHWIKHLTDDAADQAGLTPSLLSYVAQTFVRTATIVRGSTASGLRNISYYLDLHFVRPYQILGQTLGQMLDRCRLGTDMSRLSVLLEQKIYFAQNSCIFPLL